jgi:spore coat polysaccharide biosynthesis protein SpsF
MTTVAIIQARMGSSRLPRKVLMPLVGKPVLWHVIHRAGKCRLVDEICIATSTSSQDDPLVEFAQEQGVTVVRGSEDNVLQRYVLAAKLTCADVVIRITGDAPLIDPEMIDLLVAALLSQGADRAVGSAPVRHIHEGFDPITAQALFRLQEIAGDDPVAREHVSSYYNQHPELITTARVPIDPAYHFKQGVRTSVDTPSDLRFLEEIYSLLGAEPGEADLRDVVALLQARPELLEIHGSVVQKKATAKTRKVLVRCDGDRQLGLGHVSRTLAVSRVLRDAHGYGVVFAVFKGQEAMRLVEEQGFPVVRAAPEETEPGFLQRLFGEDRFDACILDTRLGPMREQLEELARERCLLAVIDDASDRRLVCDLAFYPPVKGARALGWEGSRCRVKVGWDWVVLGKQFANPPSRDHRHAALPRVLVTMGGSDPAGMTLLAARALALIDRELHATFVLGSAYDDEDALRSFLSTASFEYELKRDVKEMARLMSEHDLALASFGVTAYELAACGVPSLLLGLTQDHVASAELFEDEGIAVQMGLAQSLEPRVLANALLRLLEDPSRRREMSRKGQALLDGKGAERIAQAIHDELEAHER